VAVDFPHQGPSLAAWPVFDRSKCLTCRSSTSVALIVLPSKRIERNVLALPVTQAVAQFYHRGNISNAR
jgi:hypothetical protein